MSVTMKEDQHGAGQHTTDAQEVTVPLDVAIGPSVGSDHVPDVLEDPDLRASGEHYQRVHFTEQQTRSFSRVPSGLEADSLGFAPDEVDDVALIGHLEVSSKFVDPET